MESNLLKIITTKYSSGKMYKKIKFHMLKGIDELIFTVSKNGSENTKDFKLITNDTDEVTGILFVGSNDKILARNSSMFIFDLSEITYIELCEED